MTFAVRARNQFEDIKVYCYCFCFQWAPRETFLGSFYPCRFQINKSNFFELPSKLVTVREIAEPKVTVLTIYVFSVLTVRMFFNNFYRCPILGEKVSFCASRPKIRYCQGVSRT